MFFRWLLAATHLLGLGIGLGAVWTRARALRRADRTAVGTVLTADLWWGIAALVWIATGLARLFLGSEKSTAYYLANHLFWGKMALFIVIFAMEIGPMRAFGRWRRQLRQGTEPDLSSAHRYALTSTVQAWLVVLMVLLATGMARGVGLR